MLSQAKRILLEVLAPATRKNYSYWLSRLISFKAELNFPQSFKLTVDLFLAFLMSISNNAVKQGAVGGLNMARSACRHDWILTFPDESCPRDSPLVTLFIKSITKKFNVIVKKKKALSSEDFIKILTFLKSNVSWNDVLFIKHRFAAQLVLMFTTFARFEETQSLFLDQVQFFPSCAVITFKKSKKFKIGETGTAVLTNQPNMVCNPLEVLFSYCARLQERVQGNVVLFPSCRGSMLLDHFVSYNAVRLQFKTVLVEAGICVDP